MTETSTSAQRIGHKFQELFDKLRYSSEKEQWSKHDLDTWAEYALVLADKAPKSNAGLAGQALLCFAQLAYWRGLFYPAIRFARLAHQKLKDQDAGSMGLLISAQAATNYFHYDAKNERERSRSLKIAESALAQLMAQMPPSPTVQTELFVAAAHHWHLAGLEEMSHAMLARVQPEEIDNAQAIVSNQYAPAAWRQLHYQDQWQNSASQFLLTQSLSSV